MFKKLVNIPEKKKESLKFSEIKGTDLLLNNRLDQMMEASPFDKLMLLKVDSSEIDKILLKNNKKFSGPDFRQVFRENQNDIFRKETQSKAGEFIVEFNEVIVNIGDSPEGLRDMCFFLCKEVSKSYVYLQTLLKEYHNLVTIKEYLYSEMIVQNMQTALLKKDLRVAKGLNEGNQTSEQLSSENQVYKKEIQAIQVENQDLKLNIISLNDTIEDLRNKKQKLTSIIDAKTEELKDLEKQKLVAESKNKQILETNELSTLEENLRTILSQVIV